jgi:hypothetical protein
MENGGQIIAVLGICFVIYDSISLDVSTATEYEWNVCNPFYLTRKWWQRALSDLVPFYLYRVQSLWDTA